MTEATRHRAAVQAQDSVLDQLRRVHALAVAAGEYDAADWIANRAADIWPEWMA